MEPEKIADALDCFWNAAIGEAHNKQDITAFAVVACIAEGVRAVAYRLRENSPSLSEEEIFGIIAGNVGIEWGGVVGTVDAAKEIFTRLSGVGR